jgi:hypothetical protein
LVIIAESPGVFLCGFFLFGNLLLQLFSHGSFLFDDELDLCTLLRDGGTALVAAVLELADLVLVHLDLLVGVGELLVEDLKALLPLKDALTLFGTLLLAFALEAFLHGALDLQQLGL